MRTCREGIALGAYCVGLALASAVSADLDGRAILSWQSYDADALESEGFHQLYDLNFERDFTDTLRLQLRFSGEDDDSGSTYVGGRRTTEFRETRPGAQLTYRTGALRIFGDWEGLETRSGTSGRDNEDQRKLDRVRASLSYARDRLPRFLYSAERTETEDPANGVEISETRGTARLDYAWRGFEIGASQQLSELEDRGADFTRRDRSLQGNLGYFDSYWNDRISLRFDAFAGEGRIEEGSLGGAARVPNPVTIATTFQGLDPTPEDARDRPLTANPRLHDGDLSGPAGVPLGPDAPVDLNLAVDLGRFAEVDELRIVARDPSGTPLATGAAITWDLYVSDDLELWQRVASGVESRFDPGRSLWSVTFPRVTLRYLKVVTFFVNAVPTEVTELQAFFTTDLEPGALVETDTTDRSGSGELRLRPHESLTLTWWGLLSDSTRASLARGETNTSSRDQQVSILWEPRPWGSVELQRQLRRAATRSGLEEVEQTYDTWIAYLRWTPGASLNSTLEVSRSEDDLGGRRVEQERVLLHGFARLWEALELTLDVGEVRHDALDEGWAVRSPTLSGTLRARLTRALQWTATASVQENRFTGEVREGLELSERDERWWTELYWQPSGRLGVGARFGRATDGESSGVLQGYRLQWQPFPGGAITLSSTYDQELDPISDREIRRLILSPSWRINRSLTVNLSYLDLATRQREVEQETRSLFAALTLTF